MPESFQQIGCEKFAAAHGRRVTIDARLDPAILLNQIKLTLDYFDTSATKGKPIGWQAKEDWEAALKSMEAAGVVNAGWNVADYYTNTLVE